MSSTIITKNSSTASAVPSAGSLVQGELAVNVTDKKLYTKDNSATVVKVVGSLGNQEANAVAITGGTVAGVAQTGGTINNTPVGATIASTVRGTVVTATTNFSGPLTGAVTGNVTGNLTGNVTGNVTGNLTGNVTAASGTSTFNHVTISGSLDMDAGTSATITGLATPVNNTDAATKIYVDTAISNLVDGAPANLDTLNEIAAALNDDANLAATLTASIATKVSKAGDSMTGALAMGTNKITGLGTPTAGTDATTKTYVDTADALKLNLAGGTMSGAIAMGSNKITGLGTPTADADATTKVYVDGILGSATSAAASASAAATSATNAANSASAASTSASNASASASSAAATYDEFDDRYLGSKATAPTVDNDGNALLESAFYWNSTSKNMWVWNGTAWEQATLTAGDFLSTSDIDTTVLGYIAPGTSGNVLTSNGTTWTSAAPAATLSGVTQSISPFETALGHQAGNVTTGLNNTWIGYQAGLVNTTGQDNTAVGYQAGDSVTTAAGNTLVGSSAGDSLTTGGSNTVVGRGAFRQTSGTATQNTIIGEFALGGASGATPNTNVVIGNNACANTNGSITNNVVIGSGAGTGLDFFRFAGSTQNVVMGANAASSLYGNNNIVLGYNAQPSDDGISNEVTIGNTSIVSTRLRGMVELNAAMFEAANISATAATGTINFDARTQSVLYYTSNASGNWTLNIRAASGVSLDSVMTTGESMTIAFLATNGATAFYQTGFQVDGTSVTPKWQGGTAPAAGNASSIDAYVITVIKTGSAAFTVLASQTKFA